MSHPVVLVTGGAGFVGSHLVDQLLKKNYEVRVFDMAPLDTAVNLKWAREQNGFRYFQGDIRDKEALRKAFDDNVQTVYHLASVVGVHKYMDDPFLLIDITIGGTRNIAELALERGTRVLFTSTSEVFGKNPKVPWREDDDRVLGSTTVDRWSYATSKAVCEHMLLALHKKKKLPVTVVRYFNAYGPRQAPVFLVSKSVHQVLNNRSPLIYDSGEQTRCLTYIDDEIRGTILAAENPAAIGEVFNLGNNQEISIQEVVNCIIRASGKNLKTTNFDTQKQYGAAYEDVPRRMPESDKAKKVLGWQAEVTYEDGIRRLVQWAQKNPGYLK